MTIDYQNKRQIPKGCPTDDVFYNLYIDNGKPIAVSTQTAYGSTRVQMEAGKAHSLEIYNWADASVTSNYILTAYGEAGEVTFADK